MEWISPPKKDLYHHFTQLSHMDQVHYGKPGIYRVSADWLTVLILLCLRCSAKKLFFTLWVFSNCFYSLLQLEDCFMRTILCCFYAVTGFLWLANLYFFYVAFLHFHCIFFFLLALRRSLERQRCVQRRWAGCVAVGKKGGGAGTGRGVELG